MEHVSIDEIGPQAMGSDIDRRGLSDPLDTENVAVNHYRLEPGERFSGGLHTHMDQEEVFVIVEGEAVFETTESADEDPREVTVSAGEAIRFAPGEFQSGRNAGDADLRAIALGAPRHSRDVRIPQPCPACGNDSVRAMPAEDGEGFDLVCPECGAELEG